MKVDIWAVVYSRETHPGSTVYFKKEVEMPFVPVVGMALWVGGSQQEAQKVCGVAWDADSPDEVAVFIEPWDAEDDNPESYEQDYRGAGWQAFSGEPKDEWWPCGDDERLVGWGVLEDIIMKQARDKVRSAFR